MLHLLGREAIADRMEAAILSVRPEAAASIASTAYGVALRRDDRDTPAGTYVFLGVERLDDDSAFEVMKLWTRLAARPDIRCVNHPTRTLHRYELLRVLHDSGVNPGDVLRMEDRRLPKRWPVFLRDELVALTGLPRLEPDDAAFRRTVVRLGREGAFRPPIIICELPGADAGSARFGRVFNVGGRLVRDARAREILGRRGAPSRDALARVFAQVGLELGVLVLAPAGGRVAVVDSGTDPEQLAHAETLPAVADAMLALAATPIG